jgi:hypothetical protein
MKRTLNTSIHNPVSRKEADEESAVISEYIDYIRWLADQDPNLTVKVADIWALYHEGVRLGHHWSEACEDNGFPIRVDWFD